MVLYSDSPREWHDPCSLNVYCSVSTAGEELNCRRWPPSRANASPTCAAFSTSPGIRERQDIGEGIKESRDQAIRESRVQGTKRHGLSQYSKKSVKGIDNRDACIGTSTETGHTRPAQPFQHIKESREGNEWTKRCHSRTGKVICK